MKDYLIIYIDNNKEIYNTRISAENIREAVDDFNRNCTWVSYFIILNIICLEEEN